MRGTKKNTCSRDGNTALAVDKMWFLAFTFLLFANSFACFSQTKKASVSIDRISIDEVENALSVRCSFKDSAMVSQILQNKASLLLNMRDGDSAYEDLVITAKESQTQNSMVLTVQPPLEASIFKTRKRAFSVQLPIEDGVEKSEINVILSSAFKTYDLRPYTNINSFSLLGSILVLFIIFSLILFLINPLRQKFRFKRDHVMKYGKISEEGKTHKDPFTFVDITDYDEVVSIDNQVMLLTSWKRLKKLPENKATAAQAVFFGKMSSPTFFNPLAERFTRTDRAWYGLLGILVGWLIYRLLLFVGIGQGEFIGSLFDTETLQVSTVIAHDILLGLTTALCYATIIALVDQLRPKHSLKISNLLKAVALRTVFICSAFFLQALVTAYLIQNPYINGCIAWCLLGIAFVFPLDAKTKISRKLGIGLAIGVFSYSVFQITGISYFRDALGTDLPLFFGLSFTGCLAAALPYARISKKHLHKLKAIKPSDLSLRKIKIAKKPKNQSGNQLEKEEKSVLQES